MTEEREVRDLLRALPELEAPQAVVDEVLRRVRREEPRERRWIPQWLEPRPAALALAAALLVAMALVLVLRPAREARPDEAAIAQATLETKLALAHFARAQRQIADLQEEVLRERLLVPAARSVSRSITGEEPETTDLDPSGGRG